MRKVIKRRLITIGILITVIIVASYLFYTFSLLNNSVYIATKENVVESYENNSALFKDAVDYLKSTDDETWISKTYSGKIKMEVFNKNEKVREIVIADKESNPTITIILKKIKFSGVNFEMIIEEGNAVYFQRSTDFQHAQGIAYTIDGKKPDDPYITLIEQIGNGWYYFVI